MEGSLTEMVPRYRELVERQDNPQGSSWGAFGTGDRRGSVNFMTPARIVEALRLPTRGDVFNLDYPINGFDPPISPRRGYAEHRMFARHVDARDDWLDNFFLQSSSHIDGLRHRRHFVHGFYNGVADEAVTVGSPELGVNEWAQTGIIGRGVLLDVDRYRRDCGDPLDHEEGEPLGVALLDDVAAAQGVEFRPGDVLMIRTGWCGFLLNAASADYKATLLKGAKCPGMVQSRESLAWLWDHQFALVAADNIAFEVLPPVPASPFVSPSDGGLMHQEMIALLGLVIGELWALDELADDSAKTGSYESLVVCKPLNLVGGVGSPANALAIR